MLIEILSGLFFDIFFFSFARYFISLRNFHVIVVPRFNPYLHDYNIYIAYFMRLSARSIFPTART